MDETVYNQTTVTGFVLSALFCLLAGLMAGLWIALEMFEPGMNFTPWLSFGRLRVVHTNLLTFGFALSAIFATAYYMLQRLTRTPLPFKRLARAHLYLFNATMLLATGTLMAGLNSSKEYAEPEWPIDLLVLTFWVMFAVNAFAILIRRREEQMYVSLWYLISVVVSIPLLHIVNNLEIPVSLFKSYSIYAGAVDADIQWWYGHNTIGFIYTMPILAMFYYFLPKFTGLPIYSHRLSIVSFWALIFTYLWTGAHHLLLTPLPEWIQTVAIAFSILLIAPSWGVVINGYYTFGGKWELLRSNYLA